MKEVFSYIRIKKTRILYSAKRKPLELINKFTKVAGYKINTQKPVVFLYTRNELSER